MAYKTEERIAQKYVLPDGKIVRIMTSRKFNPVKVGMKEDGVLYVNDLRLVFLDLNFAARGFKIDSVASPKEYISSMGEHFPGVYLFDLLLKVPDLVPVFPLGCSIIFLGSRAVTHSEVEVVRPEEIKEIKKSRMVSLLGGLFGDKEKKHEKPIVAATATKVEVGFFALKNSDGAIVPDFVPEERFVRLVLSRERESEGLKDVNDDYFIFEARL